MPMRHQEMEKLEKLTQDSARVIDGQQAILDQSYQIIADRYDNISYSNGGD